MHFPIGGTGALVSGLVGLIEGHGSSVQCSRGVAQISVEHGLAGNGVTRARATGARLESGERVAADVVVSNAASAWTYKHLLAPKHRKRRMVMGARSPAALARACDLGVAMQLSNIARDVGEDARAGRVYLPLAWLREAGVDVEAWLAAPAFDARIAAVVQRVLAEAERLYAGPRLRRGVVAGIVSSRHQRGAVEPLWTASSGNAGTKALAGARRRFMKAHG